MEYTERLLSILLIEKSLTAYMRSQLNSYARDVVHKMTYDAGKFPYFLDTDKHTED